MFARPSLLSTTLAATLLSLSVFACTASSDPSDEPLDDDALAEAGESELKAESFAGKWADSNAATGSFTSLVLEAGGTYEAKIAVCGAPAPGGVSCLAMPREESGRFTILHSGSKHTLRLVPNGAPVRRYAISFAPTIAVVGAPRAIELSRSGKSQVMTEVKSGGDGGGGGGVSCGTSTCAPGLVCCNSLRAICTKPGFFCAQ